MTGIDTNVLIRYILQDDPVQAARANQLIESLTRDSPGYLTLVTVAELFWVLDRRYKFTRSQFGRILSNLLATESLSFQDEVLVIEALDRFAVSNTVDFSDCLISRCSYAAGCNSVMTFDRKAAQAAGMTLLA